MQFNQSMKLSNDSSWNNVFFLIQWLDGFATTYAVLSEGSFWFWQKWVLRNSNACRIRFNYFTGEVYYRAKVPFYLLNRLIYPYTKDVNYSLAISQSSIYWYAIMLFCYLLRWHMPQFFSKSSAWLLWSYQNKNSSRLCCNGC